MANEDDQAPRAPWTIRGVSRETRDLVMEAAARRGEPVAAWLDRAARAPSPTVDRAGRRGGAHEQAAKPDLLSLASLMQAHAALALAGRQVEEDLVRESADILREAMRRMRRPVRDPQ